MRIGVVTLHRVRNFGSLLQTYATNKTLTEINGENEVVFIDYFPRGLWLSTGIKTIKGGGNLVKRLVRKAGATYFFSKQQCMVNKFLKKNVKVTKKRYKSYKELEQTPPDFDVYVCGSDQIWNTQNANEKDDVKGYYLDFVPKGKTRVAYASSFGKTEFSDGEAEQVKGYLSKFDGISVRENVAVEMIRELGIDIAVHVVDPTLMLSKSDWVEFASKKKFNVKGDYVFVYNLNRNEEIVKTAKEIANKYNVPIINFADTFQNIKGAKNKSANTPYDFVNYILNAKVVLTDSFHATAFSLNLNKPFISFKAPRFNSRLESILQVAGLTDRLVECKEQAESVLETKIDFDKVNYKLNEMRKTTKKFLTSHLRERN